MSTMRVLFINSIFPNTVEPTKGIFIHKNIAAYPPDTDVRVVAPLPFYYSLSKGLAGVKIPRCETIKIGNRNVKIYRPRFILLPRNLLRFAIPILEYLFIRRVVKNIHKVRPIDIVHANFASPDGIAAALLCKELKLPLVITEHQAKLADNLKKPMLRQQMIFAYRQARRVICVSNYTAALIHKADPRLANISMIPNGVDFSCYTLRSVHPNPSKLIYIGYLIPHKGVHILLQALSLLKDQGIELSLSVVGKGSSLPQLKEQSRNLGLADRVRFLGEKNPAEVAELLARHDIMVHPSFVESFGIVLVEALAAGLPVVSTFNGGAEDIITEEVGVLMPINNPTALAEGIKDLLGRWNSFEPLELREYARRKFSQDRVALQTIQVYREVLA